MWELTNATAGAVGFTTLDRRPARAKGHQRGPPRATSRANRESHRRRETTSWRRGRTNEDVGQYSFARKGVASEPVHLV